jgi:hypothetical protein
MTSSLGRPISEAAAYEKLEEVIEVLSKHMDPDGVDNDLPVDAVLLIGYQKFDDEGRRQGLVAICPRHGGQPYYITAGLLQTALWRLEESRNRSQDG